MYVRTFNINVTKLEQFVIKNVSAQASSPIPSLIVPSGESVVDSVDKANLLVSKFSANSKVDDRNLNPNTVFFRQRG